MAVSVVGNVFENSVNRVVESHFETFDANHGQTGDEQFGLDKCADRVLELDQVRCQIKLIEKSSLVCFINPLQKIVQVGKVDVARRVTQTSRRFELNFLAV